MYQRWAESEKLTSKPDPAPKTKTPDPVSLQIFDSESGSVPISAMPIHHTSHTESGFGFFPKIQIRLRKMYPDSGSAPNPAPYPPSGMYPYMLNDRKWDRTTTVRQTLVNMIS